MQMYTSKDGTWEECTAYVESFKTQYTVTSYNISPKGPPDKDGKQQWHVDINYKKEA